MSFGKILSRSDLHEYQRLTVDFIENTSGIVEVGCAGWLDMGLGKTVSAATAYYDRMKCFDIGRTLVVAPKTVALTTWPMELRKWDHLMDARYSIIDGNESQRIQAVIKKADFYFISRDNLAWLTRKVGKKWPWDGLILDESSSFKSQSSGRWKAARSIMKYVHSMTELSATPAPQGLTDLWAQFYLMDKGKRLGTSEKAFKQRWFRSGGMYSKPEPKENARREIYDIISDIVFRLRGGDYLQLPKEMLIPVTVRPSDKFYKDYKKFESEMVIRLKNETDTGGDWVEIESSNAAVLTGKLLQFANGAIYHDKNRNFTRMHDKKLDALEELIESANGKPVMVAYSFESDKVRILERFPNAVVMDSDPETQNRWNRGEIDILLTHPKSSGHGLNLQFATNVIIWFGLNWSLELWRQLIGRIARQGQAESRVIIYAIITEGTVDERVISVLGDKEAEQDQLLEAVRNI